MDEKDLKNLLMRDTPPEIDREQQWNRLQIEIKKDKFQFRLKMASSIMATLCLIIAVGIFGTNQMSIGEVEDLQLAEFVMDSASYMDIENEEDYF